MNATTEPALRVVTWNVLAAPWASPRWYPEQMDPAVLDRSTRAQLVGAHLRALAPDIALLQETTPPELATIVAALDGEYAAHVAPNGPELWTNWLDTPDAWEPNGTAVVWRTDRFRATSTDVVPIGQLGNASARVELVDGAGRSLLVISTHLDADDAGQRRREIPALVEALGDAERVILAGDWNEDVVATDLAAPLFERGLVDVAAALDARFPTHPYARPDDAWWSLATLDHVLVRGVRATSIETVDAGIWTEPEPVVRMETLLRTTGSDHLPLRVTIDG